MKILITGSRKCNTEADYKRLSSELKNWEINLLLHGGAVGADRLAHRYANENQILEKVILPDYETYYFRIAPLKRNTELVEKCDVVVALYFEGSRERKGGTWDTVKKAQKANKIVVELMADCSRVVHKPTTLF